MRGARNTLRPAGFTLLEMLLVVVIVSVMTALGVNYFSSHSVERQMALQGERLQAQLQHLCEMSILQNRPHAVEFTRNTRQFLQQYAGQWVEIDDQPLLRMEALPGDLQYRLKLGNEAVQLGEEFDRSADLRCHADGSWNVFELSISEGPEEAVARVIRSETPWELVHAWAE